jgi:hypothetical protein
MPGGHSGARRPGSVGSPGGRGPGGALPPAAPGPRRVGRSPAVPAAGRGTRNRNRGLGGPTGVCGRPAPKAFFDGKALGRARGVEHTIDTGDAPPCYEGGRRAPVRGTGPFEPANAASVAPLPRHRGIATPDGGVTHDASLTSFRGPPGRPPIWRRAPAPRRSRPIPGPSGAPRSRATSTTRRVPRGLPRRHTSATAGVAERLGPRGGEGTFAHGLPPPAGRRGRPVRAPASRPRRREERRMPAAIPSSTVPSHSLSGVAA